MNYTDSVPLALREKKREDFDFWTFRSAFHQPIQAQGTAGYRTKKTHKRRALTRPEKRPNLRSNISL